MRALLAVLVVLVVLVPCVAGCGGAPLVKDKIGDDPGGLLFNGYKNPQANCYHCHGGNGQGTMLGPSLAKAVPHMTDAEITNAIANGIPKSIMEPYKGKLTDAEIADLVAWLRKEFPGGAAPAPAAPAPATPAPAAPDAGPATPPAG